MCLCFVVIDMGRPERFWHMLPFIGWLQLDRALLAWDSLVLLFYLILNCVIAFHILTRAFNKKEYSKKYVIPLILLSVPAGLAIHTVTAFLYNGVAARPFWNSAILAPKFLASAFCSGPAIMLILFQVLRKSTKLEIKDTTLWTIAELMAYTMFFNLFLTGAEIFKEFYSDTEHLVHTKYLYFGLDGHYTIVPYAWTAIIFDVIAFVIFLVPATRKNVITLNIGAVLIYFGVYIEKGIGLIIPGFTPDTLGEIYEYFPSWTEVSITMGIFSLGSLLFTVMLKVAIPLILGEFNYTVTIKKGKIYKLENT